MSDSPNSKMRAVSLFSSGVAGGFCFSGLGCCDGVSFLVSDMADLVEVNNLDVIYSYTENSIRDAIASLNGLNLRLMSVAGSCGLFLRFAADVHWERLRWLICSMLLATVVCCIFGLAARAAGNLASPAVLIDEWYYEPLEMCKLYILGNWRETIRQIDEKRVWKAACLNWALVSLLTAFALLALAVIIG